MFGLVNILGTLLLYEMGGLVLVLLVYLACAVIDVVGSEGQKFDHLDG